MTIYYKHRLELQKFLNLFAAYFPVFILFYLVFDQYIYLKTDTKYIHIISL